MAKILVTAENLNFFDIGITHIINNYILKISYSSFPYTNQEI